MAKETKAEEFRSLSVEQLAEQLDETREKLMRMRFQRATGELKDHNLPRITRRKIAQLQTILKEKGGVVRQAVPKAEKPEATKAKKAKPVKKTATKAAKEPEKKTEGDV
jgi:large subunit ribosomal protein L29